MVHNFHTLVSASVMRFILMARRISKTYEDGCEKHSSFRSLTFCLCKALNSTHATVGHQTGCEVSSSRMGGVSYYSKITRKHVFVQRTVFAFRTVSPEGTFSYTEVQSPEGGMFLPAANHAGQWIIIFQHFAYTV